MPRQEWLRAVNQRARRAGAEGWWLCWLGRGVEMRWKKKPWEEPGEVQVESYSVTEKDVEKVRASVSPPPRRRCKS